MDDPIFEKWIDKSVSSANEVDEGMQDEQPVKCFRFVDEVEKTKKKITMYDNSKSKMCNPDGEIFYPFTSKTWIGDFGASFITNDLTGI